MQYAYVGALAYTERWDAYRDINGDEIDIDGDGEIDYDWFGRPAITGYITENVPEVTLQGFEFEYDSRPWRGGRIFGYVSWLDSEITEDWNIKWNYDPVSYLNLSFDESLNSEDDVLQVNLRGNEMAVSPPWKVHLTVDHAFFFEQKKMTIVPWLTAHWEADSYLTIFNVDKHVDDMDFVILDDRDLMRALIAANDRQMGGNIVDMRGIAMERLDATGHGLGHQRAGRQGRHDVHPVVEVHGLRDEGDHGGRRGRAATAHPRTPGTRPDGDVSAVHAGWRRDQLRRRGRLRRRRLDGL